jgi:1-pyrroline-5-carboxylate dehydrogenase
MTEKALNTFKNAVSEAQRDGGTLVTGGEVIHGGAYDRGYYVEPTIVSDLPRGHHLWKEELFCPVLLVGTFETLVEALEMANNTEYGLTSGIFSEDVREVDYFFEHIRFGVSYANREGGATTGSWPGVQSFTGWKGSGSTGRGVGGPYYLLSFLREQARTR